MPYADGVPLFLPVVCKHDPGQPEGHACDHSIRRRCSGGEGHEAAAAMCFLLRILSSFTLR
eukprot:scaffold149395_cov23-Tisochrysis_lutea.AAC.2